MTTTILQPHYYYYYYFFYCYYHYHYYYYYYYRFNIYVYKNFLSITQTLTHLNYDAPANFQVGAATSITVGVKIW